MQSKHYMSIQDFVRKRTIPALLYCSLSVGCVILKLMVKMPQIRRLVDQIARQFKPKRVILFGSYAHGHPTSDSDVDLLVIMPCRGSTMDKEFEIRQAIRAPFTLDVLVRTPAEISRRVAWNDFFIKDILNNGKLLYERLTREWVKKAEFAKESRLDN